VESTNPFINREETTKGIRKQEKTKYQNDKNIKLGILSFYIANKEKTIKI